MDGQLVRILAPFIPEDDVLAETIPESVCDFVLEDRTGEAPSDGVGRSPLALVVGVLGF